VTLLKSFESGKEEMHHQTTAQQLFWFSWIIRYKTFFWLDNEIWKEEHLRF
jgi:hypothetical protein